MRHATQKSSSEPASKIQLICSNDRLQIWIVRLKGIGHLYPIAFVFPEAVGLLTRNFKTDKAHRFSFDMWHRPSMHLNNERESRHRSTICIE